ncbi:activator-dependent family glycosyltransferase [Amycolatopsis suaedae]|uniref:Activator-dependent family glycosyltransferase n=1 Tax=Amycolatopsis suaedae TaxID=2510978 RepID=A0A4Q7J558_9PSEU|nr:activator-dependent family glycosyltransferase [Amycolatopsis suaedae]RZQ61164.1 activator-dependent family glycosyltransferase [Amycolatopsis suaedae]
MRVLFVANPEKAHCFPMVPLAWALRTEGHEVRFASQPHFSGALTQAGLTANPVGRDADIWKLMPRHPEFKGQRWEPKYGLSVPYEVAEFPEKAVWEYLPEAYRLILRYWHKPACFPMIGGLVDFAKAWQPDLIIWEPLAMAGPIAAKACGAAHARMLWGIDVFGVTRQTFNQVKNSLPAEYHEDPLGEWLGAYARKHGAEFGEDMITGHFTIDQLPDSLRLEADLHYLSMRHVPYGGPAVVPRWLWDKPAKPRVALTMGISLIDHDAGYFVDLQDILDEMADLDIELVVTIPESEQRKLARVPANTRMVSYVPLHALAPTCSAVITHGGFGTFLTMALQGVPQFSAPWDFDAPEFARRAAAQGGSLTIRADEATGRLIRDGVVRLLTEASFTEKSAELRDDLLALPTPNELVPEIEALVTKHRVR